MKKSLIATLVAAPLLSLSSMSFAAEPVELSATQMDGITAGFFNFADIAAVFQSNQSPVTLVQANQGTLGSSRNVALIISGNISIVHQ